MDPKKAKSYQQTKLKESATRLAKLIELGASDTLVAREVSLLVQRAKHLCGKDIVNQIIEERETKSDAAEVGLCVDCFKISALPNHFLCQGCAEKVEMEICGIQAEAEDKGYV